MATRSKPLICSIGSTDPTAAAGIGRDLIVYERLGAVGVFAVAAITAQNAHGVSASTPSRRASRGAAQSGLATAYAEVIRIGLLPDAKLIAVVAASCVRCASDRQS